MNRLVLELSEEIRSGGPITFARFMERALYAPGLGYYETRREIGRAGDFFTSVSVGPLFGELLAFQFSQWFAASGSSEKFQIMEAGPHQGTLAADILAWLRRHRPGILDRAEYILIDPSPARRAWQEETLREFSGGIKWVGDISHVASDSSFRIIFSNEFLDAVPARRLAWNAAGRKWEECFVTDENGRFGWLRSAPSPELSGNLPRIDPRLAEVLPDGYLIEHSPAAIHWWTNAAGILGNGKLLTFDYGLTVEDFFQPGRAGGTWRSYTRHRASSDILEDPGEHDITAHVNFSAIEAAGHDAGLATETFSEQGRFLAKVFERSQTAAGGLGEWTAAKTKQFQTLTHPDHLGRAFKVLIQSREAFKRRPPGSSGGPLR